MTKGRCPCHVERLRDRAQQLEQQIGQRLLQLARFGIAFAACARAQVVDQEFGGGDANVRREEHGFELFVERFVELAPGAEEARELTAELAARLGEAVLESREPAGRIARLATSSRRRSGFRKLNMDVAL